MLTSRSFDAQAGLAAFFKCENFQMGGAFKIRGAANFLSIRFQRQDLGRGSGRLIHRGIMRRRVAIAAQSVGIPATLVMPEDAPRSKVEATRARGARIVTYDRFTQDRVALGQADRRSKPEPPSFHRSIIPGSWLARATAAVELMEQAPKPGCRWWFLHGASAAADSSPGCSIAAKALNPGDPHAFSAWNLPTRTTHIAFPPAAGQTCRDSAALDHCRRLALTHAGRAYLPHRAEAHRRAGHPCQRRGNTRGR